ncbi:MAG TPA: arginine N-succinyltransferase [Paucimonas sp.]|nr:arginine N-succinyltransferase [Paucimonas sp.]
MLVVRAIQERDLDGLMELARQTGDGMTTLKPDRKVLGKRVEVACASFAEQIAPPQRDYVFVMEDTEAGRLAGVCAIKSAVGLDEPFYNYRIGTLVHSSNELKVFSRMETLYLSNDLTGCSELCSLFLHPEYRKGHNGRLLSKSRFLFIAQFPHLFEQKLIAELRGFQHSDGRSPFWEGLGRHFFKIDFDRADDMTGMGKKSFIAELMPRHPLYVAYLPQEAQDVIGRVHVDTVPARRLLESEGMYYEGYVDIFDAGPVLQARISELRSLRESALALVDPAPAASAAGEPFLVSSTVLQDFRVIVSHAGGGPNVSDRIGLSGAEQALLACAAGGPVRTMSLNPKKPNHA